MAELLTEITLESKEIEQALIGSLVIAPEYVIQECGWLDATAFADATLGELWRGVQDGGEVMTVAGRLNITTEVFGYMNRTPSFEKAREYANAIAEKNYYRQLTMGAGDLVRAISKRDRTEIDMLLSTMASWDDGETSIARNPEQVAESLIERIEMGNISVPFGIQSVDWATGGAEKGTCTILAGRTSMGKSGLAMEFAENQALQQGKRVAFFALEMSAEQLFARRLCHKVKNTEGIPASWQDVRSGHVDQSNKLALYELVKSYAQRVKGKLDVIDKTGVSTPDIVRLQAKNKWDVIYVDHLGLLKDFPRKNERYDQLVGRQVMMLHELAKDTKCVVICLAQLNREVGQRSGNRPTLTDLRDSGKIEENADNVFLLHRDSYWDASQTHDIDPMEIIVAKYRDGARSSNCFVGYHLAEQRFVSMWQDEVDKIAQQRMENTAEQGTMELGDEPSDIPF